MAQYHASPRYTVGDIEFDMHGNYTTTKADEIKKLDALVPTWIKRVDSEAKAEKPAARKPATAKSSAK